MRMVLIQFLSAVPQAIPPVILDVGIKKSRSKVIQMNGLENTQYITHLLYFCPSSQVSSAVAMTWIPCRDCQPVKQQSRGGRSQ
ncbi:hypothetical protein B0H16DRAFT_1547990 [Mycena metata]|uniref:Uncharacterized protein n=1 Tax=Mycena metata TaxID=1033252 RepID=A0AAD7IW76_9AGAR|nr:hypothetical protein B0H16DRAFT_1547990 [Mycena metata]